MRKVIIHDNSKPAERQGRKARSLRLRIGSYDRPAAMETELFLAAFFVQRN